MLHATELKEETREAHRAQWDKTTASIDALMQRVAEMSRRQHALESSFAQSSSSTTRPLDETNKYSKMVGVHYNYTVSTRKKSNYTP